MITRITGLLNRVLEEEIRLQVGPLEYQVLVPEFVRRPLQTRAGHEVTLYTSQYHDGNPMQGRVVPRLIGFITEAELEFFELFCTVDKVGAKKALKALVLPVHDIAGAIQRQDVKFLTTLPGIGAATAEQMVTTLWKKVANFTHPAAASATRPAAAHDGRVIEDAYAALLNLGHNPVEARSRLDAALADGHTYPTVEALLTAVYSKRGGTS